MTANVDSQSRVTISPSVYARAFGKELVLLEFGRGEYFGLDEIGAAVWRRLEAGHDLGVTAAAIAEEYEVATEQALRDIVDLVTHMQERALVTVR